MCVRLTDRALSLTEYASSDPIRLNQCAPETVLYCAFGRSSLQAAIAMDPKFAALADSLHPSFLKLTSCPPHSGKVRLPLDVPRCGVYLFSEGDDHLYVGRTDRLRARHREHWSGKANDAPFAFKLARHATGNLVKGGPTRKALEGDPVFAGAFAEARDRVAAMQFRWVEEADANRQCLLEIYATVVLEARYNDFINH